MNLRIFFRLGRKFCLNKLSSQSSTYINRQNQLFNKKTFSKISRNQTQYRNRFCFQWLTSQKTIQFYPRCQGIWGKLGDTLCCYHCQNVAKNSFLARLEGTFLFSIIPHIVLLFALPFSSVVKNYFQDEEKAGNQNVFAALPFLKLLFISPKR